MNCKKCGAENVDGAKFCCKCGSPLDTPEKNTKINFSDINVEKIFFIIINKIGPNNNPNTPINLNPVYIAISVNIG